MEPTVPHSPLSPPLIPISSPPLILLYHSSAHHNLFNSVLGIFIATRDAEAEPLLVQYFNVIKYIILIIFKVHHLNVEKIHEQLY
jgi:hypothetical protein